jgi:hypothetical protein
MRKLWGLVAILVVIVVIAMVSGGCAGTRDTHTSQQAGAAWPLDSLAYLYSDPVSVSPLDDNPWRWLGFLLNPVGVVLDYAVNRPLYSIASGAPSLFGFTPEDATLHAQRPSRDYGTY